MAPPHRRRRGLVTLVEGLTEGRIIVSGGYKAINRELEDGKRVTVDNEGKTTPRGDQETRS